MTPDLINGAFEALAGFAVLNHCFALYRDKQVKGLSIASVAFFTLWGFWNLYYYPHLGQFWSFAGGVFITQVNVLYLGLLWHYRTPLKRWQIRRVLSRPVCLLNGHDYPTLEFRDNALYFCSRCGKEILDRTFDDLRAMRPMDDDELEDMHRQIALESQS